MSVGRWTSGGWWLVVVGEGKGDQGEGGQDEEEEERWKRGGRTMSNVSLARTLTKGDTMAGMSADIVALFEMILPIRISWRRRRRRQ